MEVRLHSKQTKRLELNILSLLSNRSFSDIYTDNKNVQDLTSISRYSSTTYVLYLKDKIHATEAMITIDKISISFFITFLTKKQQNYFK